jgi:hypothetical protein
MSTHYPTLQAIERTKYVYISPQGHKVPKQTQLICTTHPRLSMWPSTMSGGMLQCQRFQKSCPRACKNKDKSNFKSAL